MKILPVPAELLLFPPNIGVLAFELVFAFFPKILVPAAGALGLF